MTPGRLYYILLHIWRPSGDHCLIRSGQTLRLTVAASWGAVARTANVVRAFNLAINFALFVEDAQSSKSAAQVAASGARCHNRPHL